MRAILACSLVFALGASVSSCTGCSSSPPEVRASSIAGNVVDTSGAPVSGAVVSTGTTTTTSEADGAYSLPVTAGPTLVTFAAAGHVTVQKRIVALDDGVVWVPVTLAARAPAQHLDASAGGAVVGPRGASFIAPPNAFVDATTGASITGTIDVALTPFDPSDLSELRALPGSLAAVRGDGTETLLQSTGLVEIEAEQNGRKLALASGVTATVGIPAPASAPAPKQSGLWSFDANEAVWREEGSLVLDEETKTYGGEIGHLSWFNADIAVNAGCVKGRIVDCDGAPVRGVSVWGTTKGLPSMSSDTSDVDGRYSVAAIRAEKIQMTVWVQGKDPFWIETDNGTTQPAHARWIDKDDPACRGLGDVVVGSGCPNGLQGGGTTGACMEGASDAGTDDGGGSTWTGSCVQGMSEIFSCFASYGSCEMRASPTGMTITFSSGSKIVWIFDTTGLGTASATFYSPTGARCGEMEAFGSSVTFSANDGKKWRFRPNADGSETVTCPDGSTERLTSAQISDVAGCTGTAGSSNCTTAPAGGCDVEQDCAFIPGGTCCKTKGGNLCVDSWTSCMSLQVGACANDSDCTTGTPKCCPAGPIKLCMIECPTP